MVRKKYESSKNGQVSKTIKTVVIAFILCATVVSAQRTDHEETYSSYSDMSEYTIRFYDTIGNDSNYFFDSDQYGTHVIFINGTDRSVTFYGNVTMLRNLTLGEFNVAGFVKNDVSGKLSGGNSIAITDIGAFTEAQLEARLSDVTDVFTDNDGALDDDDITDDASTSLTDTANILYETELDSEGELEAQLVDVVDVFTNNDGALDDDDVTLADVQGACTNDFHNIGGIDATDDTVSGTELDALLFGANGLLRKTGANTFDTITDNSANWDVAFGWGKLWNRSGTTVYPYYDGDDIYGNGSLMIGERIGIGIAPVSPINMHSVVSAADNYHQIDSYAASPGNYPHWSMRKSNSNTIGNAVTTTDLMELGILEFKGVDTGNNFDWGAYIKVVQDGNAGVRVPSKMEFATCSDTAINSNQLVLNPDNSIDISGTLRPARKIEHLGDADTYIDLLSNQIVLFAGGLNFINCYETFLGDQLTFNENSENLDIKIEGDSMTNLFFSDASADGISLSDWTPVALLDVGGGTATYIDGTDDLLVKDGAEIDGYFYAMSHASINDTAINPDYALDVNGNIECVSVDETSDERVKTGVSVLEDFPDAKIKQLCNDIKPYVFRWNNWNYIYEYEEHCYEVPVYNDTSGEWENHTECIFNRTKIGLDYGEPTNNYDIGIPAQHLYSYLMNFTDDETLNEKLANGLVHRPDNEDVELWNVNYKSVSLIFSRYTQILAEELETNNVMTGKLARWANSLPEPYTFHPDEW